MVRRIASVLSDTGVCSTMVVDAFSTEVSFVFFLKASPQTIYDRIKAESHRPLLKKNFSVEKIANILSLREKNYQKANYTIETDKKTPQDIAKEIAGVINA